MSKHAPPAMFHRVFRKSSSIGGMDTIVEGQASVSPISTPVDSIPDGEASTSIVTDNSDPGVRNSSGLEPFPEYVDPPSQTYENYQGHSPRSQPGPSPTDVLGQAPPSQPEPPAASATSHAGPRDGEKEATPTATRATSPLPDLAKGVTEAFVGSQRGSRPYAVSDATSQAPASPPPELIATTGAGGFIPLTKVQLESAQHLNDLLSQFGAQVSGKKGSEAGDSQASSFKPLEHRSSIAGSRPRTASGLSDTLTGSQRTIEDLKASNMKLRQEVDDLTNSVRGLQIGIKAIEPLLRGYSDLLLKLSGYPNPGVPEEQDPMKQSRPFFVFVPETEGATERPSESEVYGLDERILNMPRSRTEVHSWAKSIEQNSPPLRPVTLPPSEIGSPLRRLSGSGCPSPEAVTGGSLPRQNQDEGHEQKKTIS